MRAQSLRRRNLFALGLSASVFISPAVIAATSGSAAWEDSTKNGKDAYNENDLKRARTEFELAIKDAEADKFNLEPLAESWGQLGVIRLENGDLDAAEVALKKSLELDEKVPENQIAIGQCFERLGLLNLKKLQFQEAEKNLGKALDIFKSTLPDKSRDLALANEYFAEACIKLEKFDEADVAATAALDVLQSIAKESALSKESAAKEAKVDFDRCLAQCLRIAVLKKDQVRAAALLKKGEKLDSSAEGITIQVLAGDVSLVKGDPKKAIPYYTKALTAAKRKGVKTAQVLNCAVKLEKIAKSQGVPSPKELADFSPEELAAQEKSQLELSDLGRPEIGLPFGKDEFDGVWQLTSSWSSGSTQYQLTWNANKQVFDLQVSGKPYTLLVKYFDGRNIKLAYNSQPNHTYDGTYDGNTFKAYNSSYGGVTFNGTRVSSPKRERRDRARAEAIAQAKKKADDEQHARQLAQEVERVLREREEAKEKSVREAAANKIAANQQALSPVNRPVKDKWALVVGISQFKNSRYNLKFAAKDATDFANFLVQEAGFKKDHVRILLDEDATRKNIMSSFGSKWLPNMIEPDDLAVVYISTHGTPAQKDKGNKNFIVAYDTEADDPYATGVDMEEVYRRLTTDVKSDRVLIVMDTCYSGGGIPGARSLDESDNFDLSKISVGAGQIVISSSGVGERSWESKNYSNGVFTKNLIDVLRDNGMKLDATNTFGELKKRVQWEVKRDFSKDQTPQLGGSWEGRDLILSVQPIAPRDAGAAAIEGLIVPATKPAAPAGKAVDKSKAK